MLLFFFFLGGGLKAKFGECFTLNTLSSGLKAKFDECFTLNTLSSFILTLNLLFLFCFRRCIDLQLCWLHCLFDNKVNAIVWDVLFDFCLLKDDPRKPRERSASTRNHDSPTPIFRSNSTDDLLSNLGALPVSLPPLFLFCCCCGIFLFFFWGGGNLVLMCICMWWWGGGGEVSTPLMCPGLFSWGCVKGTNSLKTHAWCFYYTCVFCFIFVCLNWFWQIWPVWFYTWKEFWSQYT